MVDVHVVTSLKSSNNIIILFVVTPDGTLFGATFAVVLLVKSRGLVVGELILVLLTRVVKALVVIVTTEIVEPIFVEKITIRVIKT